MLLESGGLAAPSGPLLRRYKAMRRSDGGATSSADPVVREVPLPGTVAKRLSQGDDVLVNEVNLEVRPSASAQSAAGAACESFVAAGGAGSSGPAGDSAASIGSRAASGVVAVDALDWATRKF